MPIVSERKLIKLGRFSRLLSLPRDWIKYFDLDKPDITVRIYADGIVVVVPPNRKDLEEKAKEMVEKLK